MDVCRNHSHPPRTHISVHQQASHRTLSTGYRRTSLTSTSSGGIYGVYREEACSPEAPHRSTRIIRGQIVIHNLLRVWLTRSVYLAVLKYVWYWYAAITSIYRCNAATAATSTSTSTGTRQSAAWIRATVKKHAITSTSRAAGNKISAAVASREVHTNEVIGRRGSRPRES